jgi:hypothetical protein
MDAQFLAVISITVAMLAMLIAVMAYYGIY